jgi:asparagine synthase (glutamine-hydrolysing)
VLREQGELLAWNGEIYNFRNLSTTEGFTTDSDTDYLAGLGSISKSVQTFRGMYAISISSALETQIFRDQLGVKPLYFSVSGDSIFFGSIAKDVANLALNGQASLNWLSIYQWARFRHPLGGRSFYSGVQSLPPGHKGTFSLSNQTLRLEPTLYESQSYASSTIEELVIEAVQEQSVANSECAYFLSGGLDSSLLSSIAAEGSDTLDTFSISIPESGSDEAHWAEYASEHIGTRHTTVPLKRSDFISEHARLVELYGEPCLVPNEVALSILSGKISRTHRCVISGEGADEVFGGYTDLAMLPITQNFNTNNASLNARKFLTRYQYLSHADASRILSPYLSSDEIDSFGELSDQEFLESSASIKTPDDSLFWLQKNHLPTLLSRLDKSTMSNSLEARVPFLDQRLVGLANQTVWQEKLGWDSPNFEGKHLLKSMAKKRFPKDFIDRPKVGFPIPSIFYDERGDHSKPSYSAWVEFNLKRLTGA